MQKGNLLVLGRFIHSINKSETHSFFGYIGINKDGFIDCIVKTSFENKINAIEIGVTAKHLNQTDTFYLGKSAELIKDIYSTILDTSNDQIICPGFVDTHVHAPQIMNIGKGVGLPLLEWLETITFPEESKFANKTYADTIMNFCVNQLLKAGTTTASYYGTIHREACLSLAKAMLSQGQRGYVGKVNMDQNSPPALLESTQRSLSETEHFIDDVYSLSSNIVQPIITPRFAISCSSKLMTGLVSLATKYELGIQTHLSENTQEIEIVKDLHSSLSYTDVYKEHGLLSVKGPVIMAHAIHLSEYEKQTLIKHKTGIAHCPCSNLYLQSGRFNLSSWLNDYSKIGLGTDISGGISTSLFSEMRSAYQTHLNLKLTPQNSCPDKTTNLNVNNLFYCATLGGASVLRLDDKIGNFKLGKAFDANIISLKNTGPNSVIETYSTDDILQKLVFVADSRDILSTYVQGIRIS
ncbi:guanine deaminase [bacterium]|jgi:guanine deaminase|nr:guanine deaminase [bacterium]